MAKKLSKRESWAIRTGRPKSEYKESAEGKEQKAAKKYYEDKKEFSEDKYKLTKKQIQEDLALVLEAAGVEKSQAIEDYTRNISRLEEDKATDLEDLNYYLTTTKGRTQEDLDVSLGKELRTYNLTMDREAESLQSRNLVFSGLNGVRGKEERQIQEEYDSNVSDFMRSAKRSFEDLNRLEFTKTASILRNTDRGVQDKTTTKDRSILAADFTAKKANVNATQNLATNKLAQKETLYDLEKTKQDSYANIISRYNPQYLQDDYKTALSSLLG